MRQLNRLNQYQRLWQHSHGAIQRTCVAELAVRCFCSERHLRTLLTQWQQAGWLRWRGEPGRGKLGTLTFFRNPEALRQELLQTRLQTGNATEALQMLDVAPERLVNLLRPLMGGHWQNDAPVLRIPYYRPLESVQPLVIGGRAEQHLVRQLYSGLTRFEQDEPVGDLALHWQHDEDGRSWLFWLRPQLCWHNDEPLQAQQLIARFRLILEDSRARQLLADVETIDAPHPLALRFWLRRSDYWLAHRLAHLLCLLPHPQVPQTGSGAWKLVHFSPKLVRIESNTRWHLQQPLMQAVEYWITPELFVRGLGTSCRHPVQIAIGDADELASLRPVSRSVSLGFCYLVCRPRPGFSAAQARSVFRLIQQSGIIARLPLEEGLISPSKTLLPGWPVPLMKHENVRLPRQLTLHYHLPVELHEMSQALRQLLLEQGCELTIVFHDVKSWQHIKGLDKADLVMGDRLIGDAPLFTLASWLQTDRLWRPLWRTRTGAEVLQRLAAIQHIAASDERAEALHQLCQQLMHDGILLPLFNYRYQISAPPGVEGIQLNTMGWFDFSRAWIPPPLSEQDSAKAKHAAAVQQRAKPLP